MNRMSGGKESEMRIDRIRQAARQADCVITKVRVDSTLAVAVAITPEALEGFLEAVQKYYGIDEVPATVSGNVLEIGTLHNA